MEKVKTIFINPLTDFGFKYIFGSEADKESLKAYRDAYAIAETERAEGRAEGRAEAAIEHAKAMLENGIAPDMVAKVTGLTIEKILSL